MKKIMDKISGIFIPVTNMGRSVEWYVRVFGLEIIQQSDMCTGLAFPGEATMIGLWKVDKPQPTMFETGAGYKICYYNFESFDIDYSHTRLKEQGVEVMPIEDHGGIRFFDFIDPDGNPLNIVEEMASSKYFPHKQKYRRMDNNVSDEI
jgi:glyoxylase I family protein